MSHYSLLAIIPADSSLSVEELMDPYWEGHEMPPYVKYTREEYLARRRELLPHYKAAREAAAAAGSEEEYEKVRPTLFLAGLSYEEALRGEKVTEKIKLLESGDDEIIKHDRMIGLQEFDDEDNALSTYNPDSKWDWYELGGRWNGSLKLKAGGEADEGLAGEIDWDAMYRLDPKREAELSEFWDGYVLGKLTEKELEEKGISPWYKREYYLDKYGTKEEYLRRMAIWTTYAVLTPEGWFAPGEMRWFGCSTETMDEEAEWDNHFRERFIDALGPNDKVYAIDCHI